MIETARLRVRTVQPGDVDALFPLFDNWNVVQWLMRPSWPLERDHFHDWVCDPMRAAYLVIAHRVDNAPMGGISWRLLERSSGDGPQPHVAYWLGEPHWGQGFMHEAARAVVASIFTDSSVRAISSGAFKGNHASLRIQSRLGFEIEGESELFSNPKQNWQPHINTRLTRERFAARVV